MNEILSLKNIIYEVRGKQVILDSDVAFLYGYATKKINEMVKRNIERFPNNFCFQLTKKEFENLRSQFATSSLELPKVHNENNLNLMRQNETSILENNYGGRRYLPYVFTEQGIAMLSGILKNDIAVKVSINIINAFIEMRNFIYNNADIFKRLTTVEYKLLEHDDKFDELMNCFNNQIFEQKVFFDGQIYDAYSLILDILNTATNEIVIIDNYIDKTILDILSKIKVNVEIVTNNNFLDETLILKYKQQYDNIKIINCNKFHDRFIIIDKNKLYHLGASIKDAGKKCCALSYINDLEYKDKILERIKS